MNLVALMSGYANWTLQQITRKKKIVQEALLLQLPLDVILCITDHLPGHSLLVLSHTCRSLHTALRYRRRSRIAYAHYKEFLLYLSILARESPGKWACQECLVLHDVDYQDTPHRGVLATAQTCPKWYRINLHSEPAGSKYHVSHNHVQISLKLARLPDPTRTQEDYLRRLLAPFAQPVSHHWLQASFTMEARIVDGRYLRKSVWVYSEWHKRVTIRHIGELSVCCHLRLPGRGEVPVQYELLEFMRGISIAIEYRNACFVHQCRFCATEIEARCSRGRLEVTAWQNLGNGSSIYDKNWRAVAWDPRDGDIDRHMMENSLETKRGSVRMVRGLWGDPHPLWYVRILPVMRRRS